MTIETLTAETWWAKIYMSGPLELAKQILREECLAEGICVTIEPTHFIYTGCEESGFLVGLVNYPRFPSEPVRLTNRAKEIARLLLGQLCQRSVMVMDRSRPSGSRVAACPRTRGSTNDRVPQGPRDTPFSKPPIIVHLCNGLGAWGRGFVFSLSRRSLRPEATSRTAARTGLELAEVQFVRVEPKTHVPDMNLFPVFRHSPFCLATSHQVTAPSRRLVSRTLTCLTTRARSGTAFSDFQTSP